MTKGKTKKPILEPTKKYIEREAKENKQETKVICQKQLALQSFVSTTRPHSPHLNSPLFPIHEENSAPLHSSETSKHGEVKPTVSLNSKERTSSFLPKKKVVSSGENGSALPNKSENGGHVKDKVTKLTQKKTVSKNSENSRKVTDYYPVRRSSRKSKTELKCEEQQHIDDLITNNVEDGLKVKYIEGKGRGVFADRVFHKGQFVVEYHGDLLLLHDAKEKEAQYSQDPSKGCYMYYFRYFNSNYCVDATKETGRLGRLINHSKNGNCHPRLHNLKGVPCLILVASRDIEAEEELLYDYGDRSKEAIAAHPWLKH